MMELVSLSEEKEIELALLPCEDTARRQPSANQEKGPHANLTVLAPHLGLLSLQDWEKRISIV